MKRLLISVMLTAVVGTLSAQTMDVGGVVFDPSAVTAMDMFNWSQSSTGVGTARATAMGGAMTSLGGDVSAMSVNPAGLGMYRQNDVSLTPMIGVANSRTGDTSAYDGNTSTRFSVASFGIVLKAYEGSGKVVAVNFGFGYNRVADFNRRTSFMRDDNLSSVAGAFAAQLSGSGYTWYDFNAGENRDFGWRNIDPAYWGAGLGYKCGLVGQFRDGMGDQSDGTWEPDMFGSHPSVDQYTTLVSRGGIGEYDLALGMNVNNKLYIGFTLGILDIHQRRELYYGEEYFYAPGNEPAGDMVRWMNWNQTSVVNGAGVNMKLGFTWRPVEALRVGIAAHTPTWYNVDYKYQGAMTSLVRFGGKEVLLDEMTDTWVDSGMDSWRFRSPAKLLLGASYTFGQRAIISVDYERAWYDTVRSTKTPIGNGVYNDFFRNEFRGANTLRAGVEFKALPNIALRAGYGLHGSMVRDTATVYSSPVVYNTQYVSAGAGFVLSNTFYLDVAYRYTAQKQTTSMFYYAYDPTGAGGAELSGLYDTRLRRHDILVTLGFRF